MEENAIHPDNRQAFLNFVQNFEEEVRKPLMVFYDYVAEYQAIPYKIKNKSFTIPVADSQSMTMELVFDNVIIEDGRHPMEIMMTRLRGEKTEDATGTYRITFVNGLVTDGTAKESSFTFDQVHAEVKLWNYNFNTYPFSAESDKIPWRLVFEPISSFMYKWERLGEEGLCSEEIRLATTWQFLYTYIGLYLDQETFVGYGKTAIGYDRELILENRLNARMQLAAKKIFEQLGWTELIHLLEHYEEDAEGLFKAWVLKLAGEDGQQLYDLIREMLTNCTINYPKHRNLLPIYAGRRSFVKGVLDDLFAAHGYDGHYPSYRKKLQPNFIETSFVYERKYTYMNEKIKYHLVDFVESVVDDGLQVNALSGHVLYRDAAEADSLKGALNCYFANDGRKRVEITEGLYVFGRSEEEELKADIYAFFKNIAE